MKKIIQLLILMLLYSCTYEIVDQESKNNGENEITIVNSVNELRNIKDIKDGQYIRTRAYYKNSEGGEGLYQKIEDNSSIDDGGCTIIAKDGSTYQLVIENQVSLKQFGAKGDGVTCCNVS